MSTNPVHGERNAIGFWIFLIGLLILGLLNLFVNPDFPSSAQAQTSPATCAVSS
jgi:hypothetical protein